MLPGSDLKALREEIQSIDRDLLALLRRRMDLVEGVANAKLKRAFPFRDAQREERVLQRVRRDAEKHGIDPHAVERLYRLIMDMAISHQQRHVHDLGSTPLRVAYPGAEGSFSHLAAQDRYRERSAGALLTGYETVREAVAAVRGSGADVALLPIENSTAGSINETYDLLAEGGLLIIGEIVTRTELCLLTLPGTRLEELRHVFSHPAALMQCEVYLRSVPWLQPRAEFDTAAAARRVRQKGDRRAAAIGSESAAAMHGLEVLRKGIQTHSSNATRFVEVAIEASRCDPGSACKTSLMVTLANEALALGEVLAAFGSHGVRLLKLESRPIQDEPWRYRFYIDVEGHAQDTPIAEALATVETLARDFRRLGSYPIAEAR
ncbi:MAG: bifunctional chorismate mutase/prephenate dehydratase [Acidobacteriota bacterium]